MKLPERIAPVVVDPILLTGEFAEVVGKEIKTERTVPEESSNEGQKSHEGVLTSTSSTRKRKRKGKEKSNTSVSSSQVCDLTSCLLHRGQVKYSNFK